MIWLKNILTIFVKSKIFSDLAKDLTRFKHESKYNKAREREEEINDLGLHAQIRHPVLI